MSNIELALKKVFQVEFNNKPELFLHHNPGEEGWTLGGIYQKANPDDIEWEFISRLVILCGTDIKRASVMLYHDTYIMQKVVDIYYKKYWKPLRLNEIQSQKIVEEIFLMGIVSGLKNAVKIAQKVVGVSVDGIIGTNTINALNAFNEDSFDLLYDEAEIAHFQTLADNKPRFEKYLNGWKNRAVFV